VVISKRRLVFAILGASWVMRAQTTASASFEVASIKPHPAPVTFSADPSVKGTRVSATASTLLDLIISAYHVRRDQISGAPGWASSEHYDLAAKAEGDREVTMDQIRPMLQALLADRFQLKVHRETKEVAMYALVVSKGGPKFKESLPTEDVSSRINADAAGMHMTVSKGTMAQLALRLSSNGAERPVVDQTGLTGSYTFKLEWVRGTSATDSDLPSLFTALQEQLGLKLEPTRGPSEVIVIDQAEKPSAN
jgi:uncharacterized protein (TIGR03435 family)